MDRRRIEVEPGIEVASVWAFPDRAVARMSHTDSCHGAGVPWNIRSELRSETLTRRGIITVKFNFPYVEAAAKYRITRSA
jgi:predicted alpha/beta-hydrolase family hydrolase